jgi:hypothetical protein
MARVRVRSRRPRRALGPGLPRCLGSRPTARMRTRVTCVASSVKAFSAGCSGPQVLVKVEHPQRSEDLDRPEGRCRLAMGGGWRRGGRPALPGCSTNIMSSATTIVIWVSPGGAQSRQCCKAVQPEGRRASGGRELTAVRTGDVGVGDPGRRCRLRSAEDAVDDVGLEVAHPGLMCLSLPGVRGRSDPTR